MSDTVTDLISTAEAARLAGVGTTSIKRWADQGLLTCRKTAGGHRRFDRVELERFLRGGGAVAAEGDGDAWIQLLLRERGHEVAGALLEARARRGSWHAVADELGTVIRELGRRWETGTLTVLQEHLASERLARGLARVGEGVPLRPSAPRALLAGAEPGDEHTLGLSLVEVTLREAGWRPLWAGRNTPLADLLATIRAHEVEMVALSASVYSTDRKRLQRVLSQVGEACREAGVRLVIGGAGAWPENGSGAVRFDAFGPFHRWLVELT